MVEMRIIGQGKVQAREYKFAEGNKLLTLYIYPYLKSADTFVESTKHDRRPGATTEVYSQAAETIQAVANEMKRDIDYSLQTGSPAMKAWATDPEKGQRIFQWENMNENDGLFEASKTFRPQLPYNS